MKKKKPESQQDIQKLPESERMKYEIAMELDLFEKVKEVGWKGLTAKETGKVGGLIAKRKKQKPVDT